MPGKGIAPKSPEKRARRNADPVPLRVVEVVPAGKPELPAIADGWSTPTVEWWRMLDLHPLKHEFTELDWSYLLDTALLHNAYWGGDLKQAAELRLREAKYGFTPEDRARLRIQFAQATDAEVTTAAKVEGSRGRFPGMRVDRESAGAVEAG